MLTARGAQVSVRMNGKLLREHTLPLESRRGLVGLRHHGDPVHFANLFVLEQR